MHTTNEDVIVEIIEVPFEALEPSTLRSVVESYALRDGTDYGTQEISIEAKVDQLIKQLHSKRICLVYDPELESCTLISAEDLKKLKNRRQH